jgi:hypothetical protein
MAPEDEPDYTPPEVELCECCQEELTEDNQQTRRCLQCEVMMCQACDPADRSCLCVDCSEEQ